MEAVLGMPAPPNRKLFRTVLMWILPIMTLLAVALGVKLSMDREVPLKPCGTCVSCPCPTGLNGPRCGCPR